MLNGSMNLSGLLFLLMMFGALDAHALSVTVPIFPADNPWNRDISQDPVDPKSSTYINSILAGANKFLHPDFSSDLSSGIPYNVVTGSQTKVPIEIVDWPSESDPGPYPVPANAKVESGPDGHVIVVDNDNAILYEMFAASYVGPGWRCSSAAKFDLKSNALRPDGWTSADAAGLPIFAGLARYEEVAAGEIKHALRFTITRPQNKWIHPATHGGTTTSTNDPPMGTRVRLKASYDISKYTGQARVILNCLKKYGMYVADRGTDWYISGAPDSRWNVMDLRQLKEIPGSAFEVVAVGTTPPPPPSGTTGTGKGLLGTYFDNENFTGTSATRVDPTINFDWGSYAPIAGFGGDSFSVRWTGKVEAKFSETYTFYTLSDDGVRLWVNGQLLIDNWTVHGSTENSGKITLQAGQKYDIKLEYFERQYGAVIKLFWSSPSTPKAVVPQTQLYAPTATGTGKGLSAAYFDNTNFTGASVVRTDATVDFAWGAAAPTTGIAADTFSVRWSGQIQPQFSENYTFYTQSDDGIRLWINGQLLINNWTDHGVTENVGSILLTAGQLYSIKLEYYDGYGDATARLLWSSPSTTKAIVPQSQLYPATTTSGSGDGLMASYYDNIDFTGVSVTRKDPQVNFDWSSGSPASGIAADTFSVRWTGFVQPQYSQTYTFYTQSDDGVRLWINGQQLVNNWTDHGLTENSGSIALTAGQRYSLKMEFYDRSGGAVARLLWSSASTAKAAIPQTQLFTTNVSAIEEIADSGSGMEGDSDGDGFSDDLEFALGLSPTDPTSTPFGGMPAGEMKPVTTSNLDIRLHFSKVTASAVLFSGSIEAPPIVLEGQQIAVDVGGVATFFTLDKRGRGRNQSGTVKLTRAKNGQTAMRLTVRLSGDFNDRFIDEALTNIAAEKAPRQVRVTVLYNLTQYVSVEDLRYSVKPGRTGHARRG
ncbi:MAG TPA: PA14 domain-containing protein [Planctomycetota bacterium]|nr:PA14 domain-containing protein [Planctomycetota bacterium]